MVEAQVRAAALPALSLMELEYFVNKAEWAAERKRQRRVLKG
jgi:hypothetical protein